MPDRGLRRGRIPAVFYATAALVIEVLSPGDETWEKLHFYAQRQVDEILIVDPERRTVDWLALDDDRYVAVEPSRLIDLGSRSSSG